MQAQEIQPELSHIFVDLTMFRYCFVGKEHAHRIYLPVNHPTDAVKLIVVNDGDYYDAKLVSKQIAKKLSGWQLEGGIHNVARRDGIGSLILDAAYNIGKLPTHYFQGIGGGPVLLESMKWLQD